MKLNVKQPPRVFDPGTNGKIKIKDCAEVHLAADEQVTFFTEKGAQYDVCRKSWGFYATPSLNGRLKDHHLRAVLARNEKGKYYIFLVEEGRERDFEKYVQSEKQTLVTWLDEDRLLQALEHCMKAQPPL